MSIRGITMLEHRGVDIKCEYDTDVIGEPYNFKYSILHPENEEVLGTYITLEEAQAFVDGRTSTFPKSEDIP